MEKIRGKCYRKFPGGGLEWGEGIEDCLKREFWEEFNLEIELGQQLYTTPYFQKSAFNPDDQVISIYLEASVSPSIPKECLQNLKCMDPEADMQIEWLATHKVSPEMFPLPIDKSFVEKMKGRP